jgi:glycosyltransferase involved in cell wall biosynthesis
MKVRLAVCGTNRYFGLPKYFYLMAKYLKKNYVDVELIIDSQSGLDKLHEICDIDATVLSTEVNGAISTAGFALELSDYLMENPDFDILHTCHVNPYFYLMCKDRRKVVFQPFGNELFTLSGKGINPLYCKLAQPVLRHCGHRADALLAEGMFQWQEMVKYYDNEKRMKVLPVGIETKVPKKSNYNGDVYNILAVNSLLPYEGMDLLIEAFKEVTTTIKSKLTIVGAGELEEQLREQAMDYPVTFLKNIPEATLQALYSNYSLFVSTSMESDTQMGILEAEAAGLPIVSTGQSWLINGNGIVCDRNSIAWAIIEAHSRNQKEMGLKSIEIAQDYDFAWIAKRAIKVYEGLI